MMRPDKIRILSTVYKIQWVSRGVAQGACGWHDGSTNTIGIREEAHPSEIADTFLHEVLHALWRMLALGNEARNEGVCTVLATGLATVWNENPDVFEWLGEQVLSS